MVAVGGWGRGAGSRHTRGGGGHGAWGRGCVYVGVHCGG